MILLYYKSTQYLQNSAVPCLGWVLDGAVSSSYLHLPCNIDIHADDLMRYGGVYRYYGTHMWLLPKERARVYQDHITTPYHAIDAQERSWKFFNCFSGSKKQYLYDMSRGLLYYGVQASYATHTHSFLSRRKSTFLPCQESVNMARDSFSKRFRPPFLYPCPLANLKQHAAPPSSHPSNHTNLTSTFSTSLLFLSLSPTPLVINSHTGRSYMYICTQQNATLHYTTFVVQQAP